MTPNLTQGLATLAIVALVLGVAAALPPDSQGAVSIGTASAASTAGSNGLVLSASVNATSLPSGRLIGITVSEYNTEAASNNVSQGTDWVVQGQLGSCRDYLYPFGISVFAGHVTSANVSSATPLQVFPFTACPMFIVLVTGYDFLPMSENATVLPGSSGSMQMSSTLAIGETYSTPAQPGQPFPQGSYTVAASDEWGNVVFVYFVVQS